ncbi:MAG: DNA repair protein RadC [Lachnospiraceae bacterium]|nr:DNA repair protein RadC [Lachnospiraceae bacterium]
MAKELQIKDIPSEERPYEKCLARGAAALSDAELLAVILRNGAAGQSCVELAREILRFSPSASGLLGLHHLSVQELMKIRGIGKVKAVQLKCITELSTRIATMRAKESLCFTDPSSIAEYYMERLRHEEQELLICMMFDTKNHLLGDAQISRGTVNSALISPRELFLQALAFHAVHIILVHNHPSGNPEPSQEDIVVTRRVRGAGELIGISLLDHIVIGDHCYISMFEQGLIPGVMLN